MSHNEVSMQSFFSSAIRVHSLGTPQSRYTIVLHNVFSHGLVHFRKYLDTLIRVYNVCSSMYEGKYIAPPDIVIMMSESYFYYSLHAAVICTLPAYILSSQAWAFTFSTGHAQPLPAIHIHVCLGCSHVSYPTFTRHVTLYRTYLVACQGWLRIRDRLSRPNSHYPMSRVCILNF